MENMNNGETPVYARVSIRIFAPNLVPEDVTKNLQITPDYTHYHGDYPRDNPKYSPYKHGMWLLRSRISEERPLEAHLENLISLIEPKHTYINLLAQNAVVDLYCVLYSQNGFQLSSRILKRIGDLGITFGVVLYSNDEPSQESSINFHSA